jgi:hypothetical protein
MKEPPVADDLNLLASGPVPALAPASLVRARGDQRARRSRALVAGGSALVVVVVAGTAILLTQGGKPSSLQIAHNPTPTTSPASAPARPGDANITWAAFPTVTRMGALFPGAWTSGSVQVSDDIADSDRCDPQVLLPTARALVSRRLNTPGSQESVVFMAQDFDTAGDAAAVFASKQGQIHHCPTVTTDGPGLGSQLTSTVLDSSADAFTVRNVQRECQKDHADCKDSPGLQRIAIAGHLVLTVTGYRSADPTFSQSELRAFMDDFEESARTSYGQQVTPLLRPTTVPAELGSSYYAAMLWTGNAGQTNGKAEAAAAAADWGNVLSTRLDCLEGAAAAVGRDYPQASRGDAVAVLFSSAQDAESFVDVYGGPLEGVAAVTVRCLS